MTLPNDISRCTGCNKARVCPWREECERYVATKRVGANEVVSMMNAPEWRHECAMFIPVRSQP